MIEMHPAGNLARLFLDMGGGEKLQQRVGQQGELDVLQHGLPVQRAGVLEDDAHALARDLV